MSRPGDELGQLWALVAELTEQTAHNQALIKQLKERSENVKGQSAHAGAGFPLRRFNLDITDEEFQTELERFASHLVLENQSLQFENKQLNALLKEYETTLEQVMGKFRGVAHASQQHDLALHSYYSSLLQTLQTAHSSARLHDNTSLSLLLTRLSTLLRSALRSLGGEDPEVDLAGMIEEANGIGLINANGNGISPSQQHSQIERADSDSPGPSSPRSAASPRSTAARRIQRPPHRAAPFPGSLPGSSGGYSGTDGQTDWALEREMEILRLEEENASLRQLLAIAEESPAAGILEEALKEEREHESPPIEPQGRRKSSLTVEELEAGAEEEELARASLENDMPGVQEVLDHGSHGPGTGLGGGGGVGGSEPLRPRPDQGALGFKPEAQEGSAIDDGQDGADGPSDSTEDGKGGEEGESGATAAGNAAHSAPVEDEVHVGEVVMGEGEEGKAL